MNMACALLTASTGLGCWWMLSTLYPIYIYKWNVNKWYTVNNKTKLKQKVPLYEKLYACFTINFTSESKGILYPIEILIWLHLSTYPVVVYFIIIFNKQCWCDSNNKQC